MVIIVFVNSFWQRNGLDHCVKIMKIKRQHFMTLWNDFDETVAYMCRPSFFFSSRYLFLRLMLSYYVLPIWCYTDIYKHLRLWIHKRVMMYASLGRRRKSSIHIASHNTLNNFLRVTESYMYNALACGQLLLPCLFWVSCNKRRERIAIASAEAELGVCTWKEVEVGKKWEFHTEPHIRNNITGLTWPSLLSAFHSD